MRVSVSLFVQKCSYNLKIQLQGRLGSHDGPDNLTNINLKERRFPPAAENFEMRNQNVLS